MQPATKLSIKNQKWRAQVLRSRHPKISKKDDDTTNKNEKDIKIKSNIVKARPGSPTGSTALNRKLHHPRPADHRSAIHHKPFHPIPPSPSITHWHLASATIYASSTSLIPTHRHLQPETVTMTMTMTMPMRTTENGTENGQGTKNSQNSQNSKRGRGGREMGMTTARTR